MTVRKMSVSELSVEYGIPTRTIRDRIRREGFSLAWKRRSDGVREYSVTDDFFEKVLRLHPRYKNLREEGRNAFRLPVKGVDLKIENKDDVAVTLVFTKTDVRKFADFIRRIGQS